jgi:putative methyltransferase (TIGR04325 family)
MWRVHRAVDQVAAWPIFERILRKRYDRRFEKNRGSNLFRGVFSTFEEARRSAPAALPLGYDNPASASMYEERLSRTFPSDYPVMFWLQKLFATGCTRVFDLGGHVGVSYYSFLPYLDHPPTLQWSIHDVPAVVARGRQLAMERDPHRRLSFSNGFEEVDGADVLISLGALQYLPETLPERLARVERLPRHIILNLLPLHEQRSYFTLQSIGTAFCPYRISSAPEFVASFEKLGYSMVDRWENAEKRCEIPFHAGLSLDRYHGFYFRHAN